jgi:glucan phosphoethanolaminetransferase (alkaline phosphatase superfamily)
MSTQAPLGTFAASFSVYAREAEHLAYYHITGGWNETPPDGVMIKPLKQVLASANETRQLIVLHTLGSHMDYRLRYPAEFDVFKPSQAKMDTALLHTAAYKEQQSNAYDNSILYSDYFLSEVLSAVKSSGRPLAAVLFVSDHGEDLYDQGCDNWGHGKATPAGLRVPLFFWYSRAYEQMFPGKVAMLKQHRHEPLTTESVFPLLLDAAEIHFPSEDETRSVMSPSFSPRKPRIAYSVSGYSIDFDRAHLNSACELVN